MMTTDLLARYHAAAGTDDPKKIVAMLEAARTKLYRTADGVWVAPGDWVFAARSRFRFEISTTGTVAIAVPDGAGGWRDLRVDECYYAREAAEAAQNKEATDAR